MKLKIALRILAISIALAMVASGIVIGAGSVNNASNVSLSSTIIYVPDDYAKIQWAVDNASAGDTIIVRDGTYNENVDVNKRLTIQSENGSANCIVQAADSNDHVFEVMADYVNISGFTVKGATAEYPYYTAGIYLFGASYCNISNNNVSNNMHDGIGLCESSNNIIANNNANLNGDDGIVLDEDSSNNNNISNNNALDNHYGIYIGYSSNNFIENSKVNSNNYYGISLKSAINNIITNNIANSNGYYGIYLRYSCNNNVICLNNFIDNTDNVYSTDSTNTWNSPEKITYTYKGETYENYLGNYWDDYSGGDADSDGIGDTPYVIPSDNNDNYPLMEPFEKYCPPTPIPTPALGKGIWIWKLSEAEGGNVSAIIERCENVGIEWVAIKCGDGGYFWSQCKLSTIEQFQNAGIKVFGWQYVYGDDPIGEANVANQILDLGVDGFIIDAEGEYEGKPNNATIYLEKIREKHSDSFIAYTPFPIILYHPYRLLSANNP